jgi:hypothetical protein
MEARHAMVLVLLVSCSGMSERERPDAGLPDEVVCPAPETERVFLELNSQLVAVAPLNGCRYAAVGHRGYEHSQLYLVGTDGTLAPTIFIDLFALGALVDDARERIYLWGRRSQVGWDSATVAVVAAFDGEGEELWRTTIDGLSTATAAGFDAEGHLVVYALDLDFREQGLRTASESIVTLDGDGGIQDVYEVPNFFDGCRDGPSSQSPLTARCLVIDDEGGLNICGSGNATGVDFSGHFLIDHDFGFCARLHDDLWDWRLPSYQAYFHFELAELDSVVACVVEDGTERLLALGRLPGAGETATRSVLFELDDEGVVRHVLVEGRETSLADVRDVLVDEAGARVVLGGEMTAEGERSPLVEVFDEDLEFVEAFSLPVSGRINAGVPAITGGLVLVGGEGDHGFFVIVGE